MDALITLSRVPRRPPRADVMLAGLLGAWALIEAVLAPGVELGPDQIGIGQLWQRVVFAVAVTAPLVLRRRVPFAVLGVIIAVLIARVLTVAGPEDSTFPFPSLLVATFSVALHGRRTGWAVLGGVATVAAMLALFPLGYYSDEPDVGQVFILAFFVTGAWVAGRLIRIRVGQAEAAQAAAEQAAIAKTAADERAAQAAAESAAAEERAAQAAAERAAAEERAAAAERRRIARELHDVVAHSLSIVAVQAGAAEELIALDPESARRHIAAARSTAREALTEMRHVLDVLRDDDTRADLLPQPTLERVADLVDEARAAGLPVTLTISGQRGTVPPGVDLAGFRIVQEALTNVRRHAAGARTEVGLSYEAAAIELKISDAGGMPPATAPGPGRGLVGMRERARLYGGTLAAGPDGEGFTVTAHLPRETT
ncbi:histidine kinase [Actinoplanes sp. NPDC023714]|uniref:sensor histidine kinase n=1 Tax=Actinoplanes sp. NPDC023714 TaxID=3154322 RepID=UPI0033F7D0A3